MKFETNGITDLNVKAIIIAENNNSKVVIVYMGQLNN
jgi:hypothetical protein